MPTLPDFLKTVRIFKVLDEKELKALAQFFEEKVYPPREIIIRQSENGDDFYVVYKGHVNVTRGEKDVFLSTLGPGEYFGEASLFHEHKRTATVTTADEEVRLLAISRIGFRKYLEANATPGNKVLLQMLRELFLRLERTSAELQFQRKGALAQDEIDKLLS